MTAEAFFKELKRLINSQPKNPSHILNSENCEYGDQIYYSKNQFLGLHNWGMKKSQLK